MINILEKWWINNFINVTLRQLGIHARHWINFDDVPNSTLKQLKEYLNKINHYNFHQKNITQ